ncbi:hypothetical protein [Psychrobacter sp. BF1]|uniref:hypothetical protein n=1 Tax=Psychrobacter sp. BF1 TaxID=2821147 RepID=UPI001C4DE82D|nr:hypothetical protein [Psychrobacter sp. BF1]
MALALSLNADGHGELDPTLQSLYIQQDDGNYRLDAEFPDNEGLKRKAEELLGETKIEREKRKAAEDRANALEAAQQKADDDAARANGDLESLEKSYEGKISKIKDEYDSKASTLEKQIYDLTVGQTANNIASELSIKGSAIALLPHIKNRLTLEQTDDGQRIRVLDMQGNKTAMTLDDLKDEFRANDAFKPLIAGSGASGSGANGANSGAGGNTSAPKRLADCKTPEQKKSWLAQNS